MDNIHIYIIYISKDQMISDKTLDSRVSSGICYQKIIPINTVGIPWPTIVDTK